MATSSNLGRIYNAGLHNVGSYQVSGRPYCASGSTAEGGVSEADRVLTSVTFPNVTKQIVVLNQHQANDLYLSFHSGSQNPKHFYKISPGDQQTFNVKCKELFLTGSISGNPTTYSIYASLTHITSSYMFHMTGSGLTE